MKRTFRNLVLLSVTAVCCGGPAGGQAFADITVRELPSGRTGTIPSTTRSGECLTAIPVVFERLGFTWKWDAPAQQLTCVRNAQQYVFTQDVPYYSCGNVVQPLPAPTRRIGATLYLPLRTLLDITRGMTAPTMRWNNASQVLTINKSTHSIVAVACEKKVNGVLVTVSLPIRCRSTTPITTLMSRSIFSVRPSIRHRLKACGGSVSSIRCSACSSMNRRRSRFW